MRNLYKFLFCAVALLASVANAAPCTAPYEVVFENTAAAGLVRKERATQSAPLVTVATGSAAKSWVTSCSIAGDTQYITFDVQTENWFSPFGNGDHIAVLSRASIDAFSGQYIARGFILHRNWGVLAERFRLDSTGLPSVCQSGGTGSINCQYGPPARSYALSLYDNIVYSAGMHSIAQGVGFDVKEKFTSATSAGGYWQESTDHTLLFGNSIAIVMLCLDGTCTSKPWKVTVKKLSIGRF